MTQTALKSIILKDVEVRAINEGRKTQLRRIIPSNVLDKLTMYEHHMMDAVRTSPYQPGDLIYVKEKLERGDTAYGAKVRYAADGSYCLAGPGSIRTSNHVEAAPWKWVKLALPAIFMPREFSRLILSIKEVMVERVQDISEADAIAEGIPAPSELAKVIPMPAPHRPAVIKESPRWMFELLWDRLNGPGSWDRNDWVWVITFTPLQGRG